MLTFTNPVVGGVTLARPAIQSAGFDPGIAGWTINQDGTAELNNTVVRGTVTAATFEGNDFFINSAGIFFYG